MFSLVPCIGSSCYHVVVMSDISLLFTFPMIHIESTSFYEWADVHPYCSHGVPQDLILCFFWVCCVFAERIRWKRIRWKTCCRKPMVFVSWFNSKILDELPRKYSDFYSLAALPFQKSIWLVANVCWYTWRMVAVTLNRCGQVTSFPIHLTRSTSNRTSVLGFSTAFTLFYESYFYVLGCE